MGTASGSFSDAEAAEKPGNPWGPRGNENSAEKMKKAVDICWTPCYTNKCSERVTRNTPVWGYSSAGRALDWQSRGQRFDPAYLHQKRHDICRQCHLVKPSHPKSERSPLCFQKQGGGLFLTMYSVREIRICSTLSFWLLMRNNAFYHQRNYHNDCCKNSISKF